MSENLPGHITWRFDMSLSPTIFPPTTPERFDANQVEIYGRVTKIWARSCGDVFVRIMIGGDSPPGGDVLEGG